MLLWPWTKLERRAICAERCTYGSGRRSAKALLTLFPTWQGFAYVAGVKDMATREIVGWAMEDHIVQIFAVTPSRWLWGAEARCQL